MFRASWLPKQFLKIFEFSYWLYLKKLKIYSGFFIHIESRLKVGIIANSEKGKTYLMIILYNMSNQISQKG